jgi:hypothetical protein
MGAGGKIGAHHRRGSGLKQCQRRLPGGRCFARESIRDQRLEQCSISESAAGARGIVDDLLRAIDLVRELRRASRKRHERLTRLRWHARAGANYVGNGATEREDPDNKRNYHAQDPAGDQLPSHELLATVEGAQKLTGSERGTRRIAVCVGQPRACS